MGPPHPWHCAGGLQVTDVRVRHFNTCYSALDGSQLWVVLKTA